MILEFLKELKYSYYLNEKIYTEGSCFRLYSILKTIFPQSKPLYSIKDGHWVTEIDEKFYDINGEVSPEYLHSKEYDYVVNEIILESAYIPTHNGQSTSYNKYKKTN